MGIGVWEILLLLIAVVLIFGAGKLPKIMGDLGQSARALKTGFKGEGQEPPADDEKRS
ncbi:twin-arginine translocase TatA/TatE family subunit [Lacibacterium aquatile]|uniref:Sec-independent protein translocase protein TatA n=1 Tax=Lacibacterium aquatile TaxID=1168082 RepID=A0ABW5DRW3_9PROT